MSKKWSIGARSEIGCVRNENQDRMSYVRHTFGDVFIVSDGMGGHRAGALAAQLTTETLNQWLAELDPASDGADAIKTAFEEANRTVYARGHDGNPDTEGMGATAVVLIVAQDRVMVAHLGDSRAYLCTGNKLKRLTKDHSRVQRMVDAGILSSAEASAHPDANILEQAVGVSPKINPDISSWMTVQKGDQFLLCSDGLHGYVSDDEIADILSSHGAPQELVDQLVRLAMQKGGEDNITVQLISQETSDRTGIFSDLGRIATTVSGIMIFSFTAAFMATEYWPATLKTRLQAVDIQGKERAAELTERVNKMDRTLESLRAQIVQLNQKTDQLGKASSSPVPSPKAGKAPKSKKNDEISSPEKYITSLSSATKKDGLIHNTAADWTAGQTGSANAH